MTRHTSGLAALFVPLLAFLPPLALSCQKVPSPEPSASATSAGAPMAPKPASPADASLAERVTAHVRRASGLSADARVELTLDASLQAAAEAEVARLVGTPDGLEASIVALDPSTGEVRALAGAVRDARPIVSPDLPIRAVYISGSVAKVFSVAAALDADAVRPTDTFAGGAGFETAGITITDSSVHGLMTVEDVLVFSSNIGASRIYARLGKNELHAALARFGFGVAPAIELDDAAGGELGDSAGWTEPTALRIAFGGGLRATPLQFAVAFAAVVGRGELHAPSLVRRVVDRGVDVTPKRPPPVRVMKDTRARELSTMLEGVVRRDDGTGVKARVAGLRIAGKTGTATLDDGTAYASFAGAVPAESPRWVVYVGVHTTGTGYTGASVAAPAFARVVGAAMGTN